MTKEEIITTIKASAEKLGRVPTISQLYAMTQGSLDKGKMARKFGSYTLALAACGLKREDKAQPRPVMELFIKWATAARKLKKVPTTSEFYAESGMSETAFRRRYKSWSLVPAGMLRFIEKEKLQGEWADVAEIIRKHAETYAGGLAWRPSSGAPLDRGAMASPLAMPVAIPMTNLRATVMEDRPMYGELIGHPAMTHAPTSEVGVMVLFGALACNLGFAVMRTQAAFPDCEAMRRMDNRRMQRVLIEFEFESRNFLDHRHDPKGCDLIVCWKHTWPESPLEVIELSTLFGV